jgi:class 3 adenylate cyclase/TolB-like protein
MSGRPERALATVLFTDIVGSTERAAALRDTAWRDLRQEHDRRVRQELRRFGGHEINTAGDSFLATFERPARAIACADAIRVAVRELGLEVRAGLHMGEVEGTGRELGGLALNIGARVAAHSGAGEILVSSTVHDALAGSAIDFEDRGVHPLKGVPGEWRLFAVTTVPEGASEALPSRWRRSVTQRRAFMAGAMTVALLLVGLFAARRETGPALTPEEALAATADPGIAVAPFTVNDPEVNSLREDMVVLLSMHLDGVAGLRAISSRAMLARWEERAPGTANPDEAASLAIAGDTGARYGVIGSVVKIGPEVLLTADVFEIRSHKRLGSARARGSVDDLWTLVDRLSIEIIKVILGGEEGTPQIRGLASVTTDSLEALKAYLRGEELYRRGSFEGAAGEFLRAVEIDSTFALAALQLLRACGWISRRSSWGPACETAGDRVSRFVDRLPEREAAYFRASFLEKMGSLDQLELRRANVRRYPDDPEAWFQLGDWYYHYGGEAFIDPSESRKALARSIALAPGAAPLDAYLHVIDASFQAADSARVAEWIQTAGRYTAGGDWLRACRLTYVLAFGDSAGAARARVEIASDPDIAFVRG